MTAKLKTTAEISKSPFPCYRDFAGIKKILSPYSYISVHEDKIAHETRSPECVKLYLSEGSESTEAEFIEAFRHALSKFADLLADNIPNHLKVAI